MLQPSDQDHIISNSCYDVNDHTMSQDKTGGQDSLGGTKLTLPDGHTSSFNTLGSESTGTKDIFITNTESKIHADDRK